jgi:membrane protease YdiL (CAAX protease family)
MDVMDAKSEKSSFFNKYSIAIFVVLAYNLTWIILFPLAVQYNAINFEVREIWHALGPLGPTIAAIVVIGRLRGRDGLNLLKTRIMKRSGIKLYIVALSPLIILAITLMVESLLGTFNLGQFITDNNLTTAGSIIIFILPSICYGIFEEIGWRGFLLPKLQKKYSALVATLILTVVWYFWHTPAFFYRYELAFIPLMFPLMLCGSIMFTFLFNESKGSVLTVIVFHVTYDIVSAHPMGIVNLVVSVFFVMMAIRIVKVYGVENFSHNERIKNI